MRLSLWLILIFAFSTGMCCAFAVRFYYFETVATIVRPPESTTKILVAKRTIPSNVAITADFVVFQEVPLSEVPARALTSFAQVYRRQPAYPIPAGCPICEDLLLPQTVAVAQTAFVPTGSQVVTLDVVHVRQGGKVFLPKESLSSVLAADQRVDVRVVPPEVHGQLAEKKNEVIRTFGGQDVKTSGELILENVPIYRIQRQVATDYAGSARNFLELMLDPSEAIRLTAAAKKGHIRILLRQDEMILHDVAEVFEIADANEQTLDDSPPLEQPLSLNLPDIDHSTSILPVFDPAVPVDYVQRVAPTPMYVVDTVPPRVATVFPLMNAEEMTQSIDPIDGHPGHSIAALTALPAAETNAIRNDGMVAFGTSMFRVITQPTQPIPALRQAPESPPFHPLMTTPDQGVPEHSPSRFPEMAMETPRIVGTIQFRTPGSVAPVRESPQEPVWQTESPPTLLVIPPATQVPVVSQDRVPEYSPFERRAYTVLPGNNTGTSHSGAELQAPQRLIRSSDVGTLTK